MALQTAESDARSAAVRDEPTHPILSISALDKTFRSGQHALKGVDLEVRKGEIFALLGPNGAGKTTLIGIVCGTVKATGGAVRVGGFDVVRDFRRTRAMVGLVPQELHTDMFGTLKGDGFISSGETLLVARPVGPRCMAI